MNRSTLIPFFSILCLLFVGQTIADTHHSSHEHATEHDHDNMQHSGAQSAASQMSTNSRHDESEDGHHESSHSMSAHDHGYSGPGGKTGELKPLSRMPESGKGREAGFDNRTLMESTTISNSQVTQCAQGSRGLVMVDNATWSKCGGKPKGWAESGNKRHSANENRQHKH